MGLAPGIPLGVNPPAQPQGPLDMAHAGLSVQALINSVQLQKQQQAANDQLQQENAIKLQQQQRQEQDTQTFNKVFHDAQGDWDTAIKNAPGAGVSGQFVLQAQKARTDQIKGMASANKDLLDNETAKTEQLGKDAVAVKQIKDPEERQAAYAKLRNQHIISGAYKANELPEQVPSDQELTSTIAHSKAASDMMKQAQELQKSQAELPGVLAKSGQDQLALIGQTLGGAKNQLEWEARKDFLASHGVDKDLLSQIDSIYTPEAAARAKSLGVSPEKEASLPVEPQELKSFMANPPKGYKATPVDFMRYKATIAPQAQINVQSAAMGGSKNPMVDLVGQNQVDLATVLSRMPPALKGKFLNDLQAAYPQFNQGNFGNEKAMQRYMTSGEGGKNLTAFNTAIEHAQQLNTAIDKLGNIDEHTYNKLGNALNVELGKNPVTNFNVIKNALAGEISKVFKGGQATDAEIKAVEEPFSSANSPAQLKGAVQQALNLMNSKRDALKSQYEAGKKGQPNFGEAKTIDVKAPNGKTYHFSDQAAADAFKQKAGIQ